MKAVILIVAVAMLASAVSAQFCTGLNFTMNPTTVNPYVGAYTGQMLTSQCPYGYYQDKYQGKCITYRQMVNNYYLAPCYTDADCGSNFVASVAHPSGGQQQILKCGAKKLCTWYATRAQNDTCDDNLNCWDYSGTDFNGKSYAVPNGCDPKTNTCGPIVNVTVTTGAKCGYIQGVSNYTCDSNNWCYNNTKQPGFSITGAGICMPLTQQGQLCTGKLNCAGGLVCGGLPAAQAVNYTCVPLQNIGGTCYKLGSVDECNQANGQTYCSTTGTVGQYACAAYQSAGQTCTTTGANYMSGQAQQCAMGLRCLAVPSSSPVSYQCYGPVGYNNTMGCDNTNVAFPNCTTGLQCIALTGLGNRCITGVSGDPCVASGASVAGTYKDSCQWNTGAMVFCNTTLAGTAGGAGTCIPRVAAGGACSYLEQCSPGLQCYNNTVCAAYQQVGQACNNVDLDPTSSQYLVCAPGLLCSRGTCIQNFTVSVGGLCSQDRDCDTAYCDANLRRCTQRRLCKISTDCTVDGTLTAGGAGNSFCACSAGTENMGQCGFDNCDKQRIALAACLNPLFYDRYYVNGSYFVPTRTSIPSNYALIDSQSSFYSKCSGQHSAFVRCQGLMNKWSAPSVGLGDLLNYDLQTISASSSVSVSIMVLVAFIMSAFMYL